MIKYFWTRYTWSYPKALLYMLQDTEYKIGPYIRWFHRTSNFQAVMKRRQLVLTKKVRLLLAGLRVIGFLGIGVALGGIFISVANSSAIGVVGSVVLLLLLPYILAYLVLLQLSIGYVVIQKPRERQIIKAAKVKLASYQGVRIAVAGSYGKTTTKELLNTVLSEGKKVKATPGNMNTPIGISRFIQTIDGDEDILIFELGEERVGDVKELSELTHPTLGIITGINEAHLSSFKSLDQTVSTIYELSEYVQPEDLYQSYDNAIVREANRPGIAYSRSGVNDRRVSDVMSDLNGTNFTLQSKGTTMHIHTNLIGEHLIGVTSAVVDIAFRLGLSKEQIETGLSKVTPFSHRMEVKRLHGAVIIDDTYNGNSDGVRAGLAFLKDQPAGRRIYITPGLVEQGSQTEQVHIEIGEVIAKSDVDIAVIMKNSVSGFIRQGLENGGFKGELIEVENPLEFYTNLEHFIAAKDVVLMQNDWTDSYA